MVCVEYTQAKIFYATAESEVLNTYDFTISVKDSRRNPIALVFLLWMSFLS